VPARDLVADSAEVLQGGDGSDPLGSTLSPNVEFAVDPAPHEMLMRQQPEVGKLTIDGNCWYPSTCGNLRVTTGSAASAGCARSVN
jgi:hypothetical protein